MRYITEDKREMLNRREDIKKPINLKENKVHTSCSTKPLIAGRTSVKHKGNRLVVEAVVVAGLAETVLVVIRDFLRRGEAEEAAATRVLHALSKRLVSSDFDIADGPTSGLHGLLEVGTGELGNRVFSLLLFLHLDILACGLTLLLALDIGSNRLLDSKLDGTLGDEAKIGTRETVGLAGDVGDIHVRCNGSLAELSSENALTRGLVGQRNVDKGIETARSAQSRVELLGTVGGTNDKDVLLRGHTIHFYGTVSTDSYVNVKTNKNAYQSGAG